MELNLDCSIVHKDILNIAVINIIRDWRFRGSRFCQMRKMFIIKILQHVRFENGVFLWKYYPILDIFILACNFHFLSILIFFEND